MTNASDETSTVTWLASFTTDQWILLGGVAATLLAVIVALVIAVCGAKREERHRRQDRESAIDTLKTGIGEELGLILELIPPSEFIENQGKSYKKVRAQVMKVSLNLELLRANLGQVGLLSNKSVEMLVRCMHHAQRLSGAVDRSFAKGADAPRAEVSYELITEQCRKLRCATRLALREMGLPADREFKTPEKPAGASDPSGDNTDNAAQ